MISLLAGTVSAQTLKADLQRNKTQTDLNRIKSRIGAIQNHLRAKGRTRNKIARALEDSERQAARLVAEGRRIKRVRKQLQSSLTTLQNTASRLRQQRRVLIQLISRQIRVAYALGRQGRLKLVLSGQQPGDLPRLLRYHDYINRARQQRIGELNITYQRLNQTLASIEDQNRALAALALAQREQTLALANERRQRAAALAKTDDELTDQRQRLLTLQQNKQRLSTLLEELKQAIDDIPAELEPPSSFRSLRGKLPWPVKGKITRRTKDSGLAAQSVILRAPAGTIVRAIAHGRVVFADWLRGLGQLIIIDHGGDYMSLYGFNRSLLREPGEWVNSGDSIASVGDSGGQSRPGLYFEIRKSGRPLNPVKWSNSRVRFKSAAK